MNRVIKIAQADIPTLNGNMYPKDELEGLSKNVTRYMRHLAQVKTLDPVFNWSTLLLKFPN